MGTHIVTLTNNTHIHPHTHTYINAQHTHTHTHTQIPQHMKRGGNSFSNMNTPDLENSRDRRAVLAAEQEAMVEEENDRLLQDLRRKVGIVKELSYDIEEDIHQSLPLLDRLYLGLGGADGLLQGSRRRL